MPPQTENPRGIGALFISRMHAYAACRHGCTIRTLIPTLFLQNNFFVTSRGYRRLRHKKICNVMDSNRKTNNWGSSYHRFSGSNPISVSNSSWASKHPWRKEYYSSSTAVEESYAMLRTQIENPSVRSRAVLDFPGPTAHLCPTYLGRPSTRGAKRITLPELNARVIFT